MSIFVRDFIEYTFAEAAALESEQIELKFMRSEEALEDLNQTHFEHEVQMMMTHWVYALRNEKTLRIRMEQVITETLAEFRREGVVKKFATHWVEGNLYNIEVEQDDDNGILQDNWTWGQVRLCAKGFKILGDKEVVFYVISGAMHRAIRDTE